MKTLKLLIWILPVLLLFSCGKDYPSAAELSQDQLPDVGVLCADGCDAAQLVHHPAVQETKEKSGNIEYWECPHCGKVYSDPDGKQAIAGYVFTLPTRFLKDVSPLARLSLGRPQTKGGVVASVELAASIISLCAGIASLCVSVSSITQSVEDVEAAYYALEEQSNRTEEEIALMQKYYAQIESGIDELMEKTTEMNASLQTMNASMTELNSTLAEVDKTLMELCQAIKDLVDDVRANLIIDNRHLQRSALYNPVETCIAALSQNLNESMGKLNQAESMKDTLDVFREISDRQLSVINKWALDENDRVADVMTLISTFNSVSYNYSENIPAFIEHYANHHFAWEHHADYFRKSYLLQDKYLMSLGYYLSQMYLSMNKDIDQVYAKHRLELLTEQFEQSEIIYDEDSVRMENKAGLYRHCNATGKSFDIKPHLVSFTDYCDAYCIVSGTNISYDNSAISILYDMPQESSVTREDIELMERFYYGSERTVSDLYFGKECGGMELVPEETLSDPQLVVPYLTDTPVKLNDYWYDTADSFNRKMWLNFYGYFHNPFHSGDFVTRTDKKYQRVTNINTKAVTWNSYPACFTPIYYTEQ